MPTDPEPLRSVKRRIDETKAGIAALGEMRPGSLAEHYRRCGKPGCHCARPGDPGHGPQWLLTRPVAGKTVSRAIPKGAVERTRRQIEEYRRYRALSRDLVEAGVRWCDALLADAQAASDEAAQKGASKRPSRRKPPAKSTRSSGRGR